MNQPPSPPSAEQLEYLDKLRSTNAINMFGAAPLLAADFGISKDQARDVVKYWMDTFGARQAG